MASAGVQQPAPVQAAMDPPLLAAEDSTGALENGGTDFIGKAALLCCCCCAGCGCGCTTVTVEEGFVGVSTVFGRFSRILGPGRHRYNLMTEEVFPVNVKTVCMNIPPQDMLTADNLSIRVDGVCYYHVFDAVKAAFAVDDYSTSLNYLAQVALRTVLGEHTLQEIVAERSKLSSRLAMLLDEGSEPWGIKVDRVELSDIQIDMQMQRAMAAKIEAMQGAEAKLIQAKAQKESATILTQAAEKMMEKPTAMNLQWFETLRLIATQGKNTTLLVPDTVRIAPKN